jgi:nitroimidazol reductase NimA-like FMN-containing flavoprotein (pyridoxamine 5'-phosphate oxidase superfamily)
VLEPVSTEPYWPDHDAVSAWGQAVGELARAQTYWLATLHPAGRPHVVPVLAVRLEGALCVAASPDTRKARNLKQNPAATLTAHADRFDLVIDGTATRVADEEQLERITDAYAAKYRWSVNVREGARHGEGAPTAGPSPYHVYKLAPSGAFGFPTDEHAAPTRWRFA